MKWRRNLPQRYREKVPRMIREQVEPFAPHPPPGSTNATTVRYHPGLKEREDLSFARVVSHVMLAYRYVPYRQRAQITPAYPGCKSLSQPTEDEPKLLDIFVRIVAAQGGTADAAKFEWSFMVEEHPSVDKPLVGCFAYAMRLCIGDHGRDPALKQALSLWVFDAVTPYIVSIQTVSPHYPIHTHIHTILTTHSYTYYSSICTTTTSADYILRAPAYYTSLLELNPC